MLKGFPTRYRIQAVLWLRNKGNLFWVLLFPNAWFLFMSVLYADQYNRGTAVAYYFSAATVMVALSSMISVAVRIALNKEMLLFRRYKLLPGGAGGLIATEIAGSLTVSAASFAILWAAALGLGLRLSGSPGLFLAAALAGFLVYAVIGLAVGGLTRSIAAASSIASAIMFASFFFSEIFFKLPEKAWVLRRLAMALPSTPLVQILRDAAEGGGDPAQGFLVVLGGGLAAAAIAKFTFRLE